MNIDKLLKDNKIEFILKKRKNINIYIISDEKMLIVIKNNNNVFSIDRKTFNEIDEELLPYSFYLFDSNKNQGYFIKIKEPNNFLRNSFDSTDKNEIYFGKQVLNNKIKEEELLNRIEEI